MKSTEEILFDTMTESGFSYVSFPAFVENESSVDVFDISCKAMEAYHTQFESQPMPNEITKEEGKVELNENQQSLMFAFIDWLYSARYSKYWGSDEPNNGKWYKSGTMPDRTYYTLKELFNMSLNK